MHRVLSIQSHVVHGYVGNKSATFPLQLLGFDVDALNTVQFSNHTGYPSHKGQVFGAPHLLQILEGLRENGLTIGYTHLLSGYLGSADTIEAIKVIVQRIKEQNPEAIYVLDPVMGDDGKIYVSPTIPPLYRDVLLPLADIVTPNQFEAELLTGLSIRSLEDCIKAINALHDLGVEKVVITSAEFPHSSTNEGSDEPESLVLVGSHRPRDTASSTPPSPPFTIQFPKVPARFTGTGDLFASLILAFESLYGFRNACERATSVMQRVIRRTLEFHNLPLTGNEKRGNMDLETIRQRELRLVQSRDIFMQAPLDYTAQDIAA